MFVESFKSAFNVLKKKPFTLWGLSLLSSVIILLTFLLLGIIPALAIAVVYLLSCGMAKVYIDGLIGKEVYADQMFVGFSKRCFRMAGGMAWMSLWIFLWYLIPIVGPVIAIVKAYSYRFVPYILVSQPEVSATQALKLSMMLTDGVKGQMFLADLCFVGIVFGVSLVLALLSLIPILGILFMLVLFAFTLVVSALSSVFVGLYQTYFFLQQNPPVNAD